MKLFLFSILLMFAVSCVNKDQQPVQSVELRRFEPLMVYPEELARIKAICQALETKSERINVMVGNSYTFGYAQKGCSESGLPELKDIKVKLIKTDTDYLFKKEDGDLFGFSSIETAEKGVMAAICSNLMDLKSPMQTSSKGAIWFSTFTSTSRCSSDMNNLCIHIQRGTNTQGVNYQIHTNEWIKFRIRNERIGFFTERTVQSSADCAPGSFIERKAILK